jgi:hypothetical protein
MKIRIIKDLHLGMAGKIQAGVELYGRIVQVDPLCKMFQCTIGEHSGKEIPFKFYAEIPEDKTFAELRVIELEQTNLQRLEEVKGLQHKVESLMEFSNKKVEQIRQLNGEVSRAWTAHNTEVEARIHFEAALERAMLDHQPVVLPKEVISAIKYYEGQGFSPASFARLFFKHQEKDDNEYTVTLKNYTKGKNGEGDKLFKSLVNGYTVEETAEDAVVKELTAMIQQWTNEPTFEEEETECRNLAVGIIERVKEIYSKN